MAYTRTFTQLSTAVQQLGQWENSSDITPEVLLQAVNYGLVAGYDLMVQKWADYYTQELTFAVTTASTVYSTTTAFPLGFYKLRHLDFSQDGAKFFRMYPMDLEASYLYSAVATSSGRVPRYRLSGGTANNATDNESIVLAFPTSGTIKAYYIPQPFQFSSTADTTTVKFVVPIEERLITHFAHRDLLTRSDLPTADVDQQIKLLAGLLRVAADGRDSEAFTLDPRGPRRSWRVRDEDWWP